MGGGGVHSILLLPLVARCLETIEEGILHMFVFMSLYLRYITVSFSWLTSRRHHCCAATSMKKIDIFTNIYPPRSVIV